MERAEVVIVQTNSDLVGAIARSGNFMARPVCIPCHENPPIDENDEGNKDEDGNKILKGAFFYRKDMPLALRLADLKNEDGSSGIVSPSQLTK